MYVYIYMRVFIYIYIYIYIYTLLFLIRGLLLELLALLIFGYEGCRFEYEKCCVNIRSVVERWGAGVEYHFQEI